MGEKVKTEGLRVPRRMRWAIAGAFLLLVGVSPIKAQQQPAEENKDSSAPAAQQPEGSAGPPGQQKAPETTQGSKPSKPSAAPYVHSFWDRENDWLFAGVAAGRALDYASTLNLRRRGINEAFLTNSVVDNHPLFATIEVAATGASIGVSYIFHATGHHRLERWTSIIHFGVATGGAIRNYALKTPHPG
jgi:hypothetical protein